METQQICTFYAGDLFLGIDARKIREVTPIRPLTPIPHSPHAIAGLLNLRSQIVPVLDLRRCLKLADREEGAPAMNVITHGPEGLIALLVDRVGDVIEPPPDSFEPPPNNLSERARSLLHGAYMMDDALLLALDTDAVADPRWWQLTTPPPPPRDHTSPEL